MALPGSVRLIGHNDNIISYPKPTDDYDDPLVSQCIPLFNSNCQPILALRRLPIYNPLHMHY